MASQTSVKVKFGDDLRRFYFSDNSFSKLLEMLDSIYQLQGNKIIIKYKDDEEDWITLSSDKELQEGFQYSKDGVLRLLISLENKVVAMSSNAEVPRIQHEFSSNIQTRQEDKKINKYHDKMGHFQEKSMKYGMARLVQDVTIPIGFKISPGEDFVKTWRIRNESNTTWPDTFFLSFKKGHLLSNVQSIFLPKSIGAGEEFDISVPMKAPMIPGMYMSIWRLMAEVRPFGQPFRCKIWICDPNATPSTVFSHDLEGCLAELATMGFHDTFLNQKLLLKCHNDMDKVVWKLLKKQSKIEKKGAFKERHRLKDEKKSLKAAFWN